MSPGLSTRDVATLIGVPESRVRYWGADRPRGPDVQAARGWTTAVRVHRSRRGQGSPGADRGRRARATGPRGDGSRLRAQLPALDRPLLHLRVQSDGERLVVTGDQPYEPLTGQRVMDFSLESLSKGVAELHAAVPVPDPRAR